MKLPRRGIYMVGILMYATAAAADGCLDFKWDVARERALFRTDANAVAAASSATAPPRLALDHLYLLKLTDRATVQFATLPGHAPAADSYAGLATVLVQVTGNYRIAVDAPLWIDVVSGKSRILSNDYQGQRDCSDPHKIVEFTLTAGTPVLLQLSGSDTDAVRITVTASPPRVH